MGETETGSQRRPIMIDAGTHPTRRNHHRLTIGPAVVRAARRSKKRAVRRHLERTAAKGIGSSGGARCRDALVERGWQGLITALLRRFDEVDLHRLQRRGCAVLNRECETISFET